MKDIEKVSSSKVKYDLGVGVGRRDRRTRCESLSPRPISHAGIIMKAL